MSSTTAPTIVMAVCTGYLFSTGKLEELTLSFFELSIPEQICLCAMLFATVYHAVAISHFASTGESHHSHDPPPSKLIDYPLSIIQSPTTSDRDKFLSLFPLLRDEMCLHMSESNEMNQEAVSWCNEMMDYNVPGGKLNRGMMVVAVSKTIKKSRYGQDATPLEEARAIVLGWTIEFLQAFFLVADDVMDGSKTRRGQPCWYKVPKVELIAINDSFLLESFVFTILKRHFGHEDYYKDLVDLFLDVVQKTEFGQLLDLTSQPLDSSKVDLERFTLDRYRLIVKYKTAFYSFYLSVAIGMITCHMSPVKNKKSFEVARDICLIMGEYFQIQDDYLDCFGDPKTIGKIGTDIQDNKCSWLVVQALNLATPQQKELLKQNYGKWDDDKVKKVKELYADLNLPEVFKSYEEESYDRIQKEMDRLVNAGDDAHVPKEVFEIFLKKIYKRSK